MGVGEGFLFKQFIFFLEPNSKIDFFLLKIEISWEMRDDKFHQRFVIFYALRCASMQIISFLGAVHKLINAGGGGSNSPRLQFANFSADL